MPKLHKQDLHLDSTLQELMLHEACIESDYLAGEIVRLFEQRPLLPGILLMQEGALIGLISRRHFFEHMSRPYSLELFLKRSMRTLYSFTRTETSIFSEQTSIVTAAKQALERSPELLYEPVVVQCLTGDYRLLDVHQLLLAHAQIHELAMAALQNSQQALAAEKELAQITLNSIGDAVVTTDAEGYIKSLNPVAERLTGWTTATARGLSVTDVFRIINEYTREPAANPLKKALDQGRTVGLANHTLLIARDGQEFSIDDSAAPIYTRDGTVVGAVLVFRDVTQQRQMSRQLSWQASHDALTGLANRHEFERQLDRLCDAARDSGEYHILCYMDLDRFKIVNDTCGHLAGDELLRQISTLLQAQIRKTDTLARIGGDEFGLLLRQCPLEQGIAVARSIRQRLHEFRFIWQDKPFAIGVSIGLTAIDRHTPHATSALSQADAACFWAKHAGRNRVRVYQPDDDTLTQHGGVQWIAQLTKALEENQFCLYYQQIVAIASDAPTVEHYEILLRLPDQTGNLVSPAAFLPTAERYNLMPAIDRWVVQTLFKTQGDRCRDRWHYHQHHPDTRCHCLYAVNLSGASLNDDGLIDFLQEQFEQHQIPPQTICFEITETVAVANLSKAASVMQTLKHWGCQFALDDFGSGMSSFAYLKNLPVDYLKIDGSFVKDIVDDPVASAMVEAINRIGQMMGLRTIAECVEDEVTLAKLKLLGVDYAQGFGLSIPRALSHLLQDSYQLA